MLEEEWPQNEIKSILATVTLLHSSKSNDRNHLVVSISDLASGLSKLTVFNYSFTCAGRRWSPLDESFSSFVGKYADKHNIPVAAETAAYQYDQFAISEWLRSLLEIGEGDAIH